MNNETALSVGNDGFVILWNISSGGNYFGEYPSTIVGLATKTETDQEEIVDARGMEFGELTKKIYTPDYKSQLVNIDIINGTEKLVTSTREGNVHIFNINSPGKGETKQFPKEEGRTGMGEVVGQCISKATEEIIVANKEKILFVDPRQLKPSEVIQMYPGGQNKRGPVTAISGGCCELIEIGCEGGYVQFLDRTANRVLPDDTDFWNITPDWVHPDKIPVSKIGHLNHKIIAGGGTALRNRNKNSLPILTVFE